MNIDKCTEQALEILDNKGYKRVNKRNKVVALVAAFLVMTSAAAFPAYAVNKNPVTEETVAAVNKGETVYVYSRDWVNVRSVPEFGDTVITTVAPNTKIEFKSNIGEWSKVIYNGESCYMYTYYLSTEPVEYKGDVDIEDAKSEVSQEDVSNVSEESSEGSGVAKATEVETDTQASDTQVSEASNIDEEVSDTVESDTYDTEDSYTDTEYYSTDGVYYGTTDDGDEVYRNDSGLFDAYSADGYMTTEEFRNYGIVNHNGECFTYYSELVLPGEGLEIPGRYTDYEGYVCDGEGCVVLATPNEYTHPRGSTIELPTGRMGKFYDFCPEGSIDVYVGW